MFKLEGEYITLQQFLKAVNIASTGGEAKLLIQEGHVCVNGETETRRGRKLYPGDEVKTDDSTFMIQR